MLWIKKLASSSFLVLSTHILHFNKKNLSVLDISRFTTGEIGPESRLYPPLVLTNDICFVDIFNAYFSHSVLGLSSKYHKSETKSTATEMKLMICRKCGRDESLYRAANLGDRFDLLAYLNIDVRKYRKFCICSRTPN